MRELLTRLTGLIPNEGVAGIVFAVSIILTDHLFNLRGNLAWMVKRHGVEGLKDMILGEAAKGLTVPSGNFCGTARVTQILMGEE